MSGKFIVFEGIDRSGKSTQARRLYARMMAADRLAVYYHFPNFELWPMRIYRKCGIPGDAEQQHIIYETERRVMEPIIKAQLEAGITVIVDRWIWSGIAYSQARGYEPPLGQWSIKPDFIFMMDIDPIFASHRPGYGKDNETLEFQKKVYSAYQSTFEDVDIVVWLAADSSKKEIGDVIDLYLHP